MTWGDRRVEPGACARLYAAWAQSRWSNPEDRDLADRIEGLAPGTAAIIRHCREFHRRATVRAIGEGAGTVIYAPAGLPADPEPHLTRDGRVVPGKHVFADPDPGIVLVNQAVRAVHERVHSVQGWPGRPDELLAAPVIAGSPGPWCVHLRLVLHFWPPDTCAQVIARYGALMPPGSWLVTSAGLPGAPTEVDEVFAGLGAPLYWHAPGDVAGWAEAAGMRVAYSGARHRPGRRGGLGKTIARLP